MTCELIQSQLTAFLDGELPAETITEIEAHLQTCSECAGARNSLSALSETLAAWAVSAPDIAASVMQSITAEELALLRAEMRELRTEIRRLREEVAALRRPVPAPWFPVPTPNYARMPNDIQMEEDPWKLVRS